MTELGKGAAPHRLAWPALKRVVRQSMRDDVMGLAAELSYRFFLALFPFALFLAALGGFVAAQLPIENPAQRAVELLGDALPGEATELLRVELERVIANRTPGLLSAGAILALFFATGGMNAIIKALDRAYSVSETRPFWKRYLVALVMTVVAGAAVIVAFVLLVPLRMLGPAIGGALGLGQNTSLLVNLLAAVLAFVLIVGAVAYVFRVAPNIRLPLRAVLPGAFLFAVVWVAATLGFSFWVTNFGNYGATYGALAGVVIALIWFYVSALLLLVAAEVNEVLHELADPADVENRRRDSETEGDRAEGAMRRPPRRPEYEEDTEADASPA